MPWQNDSAEVVLEVARNEIANSRRAAEGIRSKLLAKRPHSGGHRPGRKLKNVGKNPGRTREDLDFLAIRNSREIPAKFHENLAKFDQNFAKF